MWNNECRQKIDKLAASNIYRLNVFVIIAVDVSGGRREWNDDDNALGKKNEFRVEKQYEQTREAPNGHHERVDSRIRLESIPTKWIGINGTMMMAIGASSDFRKCSSRSKTQQQK